jgi:hypothetical protein
MCAPARNRTSNNGLEVRSYIHLTTGASEEKKESLLSFMFRTQTMKDFLTGASEEKRGSQATLTFKTHDPDRALFQGRSARIAEKAVGGNKYAAKNQVAVLPGFLLLL